MKRSNFVVDSPTKTATLGKQKQQEERSPPSLAALRKQKDILLFKLLYIYISLVLTPLIIPPLTRQYGEHHKFITMAS